MNRIRFVNNREIRPADVFLSSQDFHDVLMTPVVTDEAARTEQQVLKQLLQMYGEERQLVACEIHDGVVQCLTGAVMHLEASLRAMGDPVPSAAKAEFDKTLQLLRDGIAEARGLMSGLGPPSLSEFGLIAAVDHLVRESRGSTQTSIEWSHCGNFDGLAPPLEAAVFRIIQESFANALRHSDSYKVRVVLNREAQRILVKVEDWGRGFDHQKVVQDRFGIRGICQRAKVFGGEATIDSAPGKGTRIIVDLPFVEATS